MVQNKHSCLQRENHTRSKKDQSKARQNPIRENSKSCTRCPASRASGTVRSVPVGSVNPALTALPSAAHKTSLSLSEVVTRGQSMFLKPLTFWGLHWSLGWTVMAVWREPNIVWTVTLILKSWWKHSWPYISLYCDCKASVMWVT